MVLYDDSELLTIVQLLYHGIQTVGLVPPKEQSQSSSLLILRHHLYMVVGCHVGQHVAQLGILVLFHHGRLCLGCHSVCIELLRLGSHGGVVLCYSSHRLFIGRWPVAPVEAQPSAAHGSYSQSRDKQQAGKHSCNLLPTGAPRVLLGMPLLKLLPLTVD